MSARHLQALRAPGLGSQAAEDQELEEVDSSEEEEEVAARGGFHLLLDSSDEEEEEEEGEEDAQGWEGGEADEEEEEEEGRKPEPQPVLTRKAKKVAVVEDDEDAWLEIQRQAVGGGEGGDVTARSNTILQTSVNVPADAVEIDTKSLSLDKELKSRFGDEGVGDGGGGGGGGGGGRGGRRRGGALGRGSASVGGSVLGQLYQRRCFFGAPKEDWPRPPTYVGGGIRMVRLEAPADYENEEEASASWYGFEWSPAFQALQQDYELVQETCDPNALAVFLAHHPHHAEGLLTLALIYATHGQMDRSHDYVRCCLFIYEAAYIESFRAAFTDSPGIATGAASGGPRTIDCRMDVRRPENRPFFMALFRHVQMLGGRGLYQTAFEVAKFLLALDPRGDPTGIWLCLDYYALRAGKRQQLLAMQEAGFPIGRGWKEPRDDVEEWQDGSDKRAASEDDEELNGMSDSARFLDWTVSALPNVCFSCALALFLSNSVEDRAKAKTALRLALLRFPVVVKPLIEKSRNELGSRITQPWDGVLRHPFFANAEERLPPECVLLRLVAVYAQRSYDLWAGDSEAMQFLFDGAWAVLVEVEREPGAYKLEEEEVSRHYGPWQNPLDKYRGVAVADYGDEWPRLPADLNPLDPALADPAVARRGRLRLRRGGGRGLGDFQHPQQQVWGDGDGMRRMRSNLDPNLPLAELFWRSLLPWNTVRSSRYG